MSTQFTRKGCHDIWNAFMVEGAVFSEHDIPYCPTTSASPPKELVSFVTAKAIYNKETTSGNLQFHNEAFVHFCIDDQKFDSTLTGIWSKPYEALKILEHFGGVITPDFSTYSDFPDPLIRWNIYRMRAFGFWLTQKGISVINNVRWGSRETWEYCFDGLPNNSILFIGTVASGLRSNKNHELFCEGLRALILRTSPKTIVIYGSSRYPIFEEVASKGIQIVSFHSDTCTAYERRRKHE